MMLPIAESSRVESHVRADGRAAGLDVEERGEPVRRLADVPAAPAVVVEHSPLRDLAIDAEHGLVDAGSGVARVERQVTGATDHRRAREFSADAAGRRPGGLFERDVRGVEVDDGGVAEWIAFALRAVVFRDPSTRGLRIQM